MHALTRSTSGTYCWQSRIASGSQAARCFGVHCCAAAGKDANVSARPNAAERPVTARRFGRVVQILILEPPLAFKKLGYEPVTEGCTRLGGSNASPAFFAGSTVPSFPCYCAGGAGQRALRQTLSDDYRVAESH